MQRNGESSLQLESCLEFRNADIRAFVRHLHERRCERCLALFAAIRQRTAQDQTSAREQRVNQVPATERCSVSSVPIDRSLDRWLIREYFLIPDACRPIAGSNDWFRWLDEFQQRHAADVAGLTQPLAQRARQVLWNSR